MKKDVEQLLNSYPSITSYFIINPFILFAQKNRDFDQDESRIQTVQ
jgi:hypothetical protein